jgi:hypothetical protein
MTYRVLSSKWEYMPGSAGQQWEMAFIEYNACEYRIYWERDGDRVIASDEPYWNVASPCGGELTSLVDLAHSLGLRGGVVLTPYALPEFGGTATEDQLIDAAQRSDFVALDPYLLGDASPEGLLNFTRGALAILKAMGKETLLCLQGFAEPGREAETAAYNAELLKLCFDEVVVCDAIDFSFPPEWQIDPPPVIVGCPSIDTFYT